MWLCCKFRRHASSAALLEYTNAVPRGARRRRPPTAAAGTITNAIRPGSTSRYICVHAYGNKVRAARRAYLPAEHGHPSRHKAHMLGCLIAANTSVAAGESGGRRHSAEASCTIEHP